MILLHLICQYQKSLDRAVSENYQKWWKNETGKKALDSYNSPDYNRFRKALKVCLI